jgi:POT family proton-dependent oligopeptide transporter
MTSKLSPKSFATMLMGVWLLVSAFGNFAAGAMGEIYGTTPPIAYFGYMTLALLGAGTVLIFLVPRLTRMMHGVK